MSRKQPDRRPDSAHAFLPDPSAGGSARTNDDLAENLAEEFVASATSAEEIRETDRDRIFEEELGGPFVEVPAHLEFADDVDGNNPEGAAREALPSPMRAQ